MHKNCIRYKKLFFLYVLFYISIIFKSFLAFMYVGMHQGICKGVVGRAFLHIMHACIHNIMFGCSFYAILENFIHKKESRVHACISMYNMERQTRSSCKLSWINELVCCLVSFWRFWLVAYGWFLKYTRRVFQLLEFLVWDISVYFRVY